MNETGTHPPPWLLERIGEEILRGMRLLRENNSHPGLVVDSIRFALFLDGAWARVAFDRDGQVRSVSE